MTLAWVAGEMLAPGLKQRDTADCDTPASRATSYEVTRRPAPGTGRAVVPGVQATVFFFRILVWQAICLKVWIK